MLANLCEGVYCAPQAAPPEAPFTFTFTFTLTFTFVTWQTTNKILRWAILANLCEGVCCAPQAPRGLEATSVRGYTAHPRPQEASRHPKVP